MTNSLSDLYTLMTTLDLLRQVNLFSSILAVVVTGYLFFTILKRFRQVKNPQKRATGAALLGIGSIFFLNSTLLLATFISIVFAYNAEFVSTFSNARILFINIITILISIVILLIDKGKI